MDSVIELALLNCGHKTLMPKFSNIRRIIQKINTEKQVRWAADLVSETTQLVRFDAKPGHVKIAS